MTTIASLLARHNALADKPLATWKASKAKLLERIAELEAAAKPKPAPKRDDLFHITDLCRELSLNAKVTRAKLRRLYAGETSLPAPVTKWAWDPTHAATIRAAFTK